MTLMLAVLFVAAVLWVVKLSSHFDTFLSPVSIFGLSILIYLIAIPVEVYLTGVPFESLATDSQTARVVALAIVAFSSFSAAYVLIARRGRHVLDVLARIAESPTGGARVAFLLALGLGLVLVIAFPSAIGQAGTYSGNIELTASNSAYSALLKITLYSYALSVFAYGLVAHPSASRLVLLAVPFAVWGVYSSDKDPIILGALALTPLFLRHSDRFKSEIAFVLSFLGAGVVIGVTTLSFSLSRGGASGTFAWIAEGRGVFRHIEPAGPMRSVLSALSSPPHEGYLLGDSIYKGYVLWIPKYLWPNRPLDLSQVYAMETMPNWRPGHGRGFSLLAEGLMNGGVLGVALLFALVGLQIGIFRNWLVAPAVYPQFDAIKLGALYVLLFYVIFISLRGPFSLLMTQGVHTLLLLVSIWIAVGLAQGVVNTNRRLIRSSR